MTTLDTAHSALGLFSAPGRFFAGLIATFNTWNDDRMTRKSLSRLTDRELDDIGLIRSDIQGL